MNAIDFPLCLRNFFGKIFQPFFVASIEAVSAFGIPYGNDMHFPSVFGKGRLYIVPEENTYASACWSWSDRMEPNNLHMCGNLRQGDVRVGTTCGHPFIP